MTKRITVFRDVGPCILADDVAFLKFRPSQKAAVVVINQFLFFHFRTVHPDIIKVLFIHQLMH